MPAVYDVRERAQSTPDDGSRGRARREGDEERQRVHAHEPEPDHRHTADGDTAPAVSDDPIRHNRLSMTTNSRQPRVCGQSLGLAVGSVVGGLLAYVFFALVTRALGAEAAAPVSVLWVWWGFAAAALTFPLQHWITRTVTAYEGERVLRLLRGRVGGRGGRPGGSPPGCRPWLARDLLFGRDGLAFPLLVVAVTLGSGLLGVVRGTLSARRRFAAVGASLTAENGLRCVAAAVLVVEGVDSPSRTARAWSSATSRRSRLALRAALRARRDAARPGHAARPWSAASASASCSPRRR